MRKKEAMSDHSASDELAVASNGKSRKLRAGFATLAVLGLGAGVTLAAWSDNVPFTGTAHSANVNLVGAFSPDGSVPQAGWSESPSFDLQNVPGYGFATGTLFVRDANGSALNPRSISAAVEDSIHQSTGDWSQVKDLKIRFGPATQVENDVKIYFEAQHDGTVSSDLAGQEIGSFVINVTGVHA